MKLDALERPQALLLCASLLATLLPHLPYLPVWLGPACIAVLAAGTWRLALHRPPPPRVLTLLLTLGATGGVAYTFHHFLGREPGTAILAAMLVLKLLESRSTRDAKVALFLSFFLQLSVFFTTQSLVVAAGALLATTLTLASFAALEAPALKGMRLARETLLLVFQALPLMLVLFVLFPRVQGPLWGMPSDSRTGLTGLSDSMSPGAFNELIASDEIALLARFDAPPPPPSQRYWRGPVLTLYDGTTWRPFPAHRNDHPDYQVQGRAYAYQLTVEPHGHPWLLALDFPGPGSKQLYASDHRLLSARPVDKRTALDLVSYPTTPTGLEESTGVLAAARQLPAAGNPRARALGATLKRDHPAPEARAAAAIDYFRRAGLQYTLSPGAIEQDTVDGFLFDTKRGFCEHFSSAFVFLLRASGIPARVVTGYQGGVFNAATSTLTVRQSDAHAWAEAWFAGRGWVRFDPTATAVPQRISQGLENALPSADLPLLMQPRMHWLRSLRNQWEGLNQRWNQWVIGYNTLRQRDLLAGLGLPDADWKDLSRLLALCGSALLVALFAWAMHGRQRLSAEQAAWATLCGKLAAAGLPRHAWEGPEAYGERAASAFPGMAEELRALAQAYADLRYGTIMNPSTLNTLSQGARRLRLK